MGRNTMLVLLLLLLLFDMATTAYAVRRWGAEHEANPLFRLLFEKGTRTQMLIVDAATIALVMVVAYLTPKDVAFVLVVVFAAVALNNVVTIARLEGAGRGEARAATPNARAADEEAREAAAGGAKET